MEQIKVAIIGFAHMHVNEISQYIREEPGMRLVGIADVKPDMQELVKRRYTRQWNIDNVAAMHTLVPYDDYNIMLEETTPDICFLLCENSNKAAVTEDVTSRGIHVCIEKPMAMTLAEAKQINALSEKYGVEIMVNWPTSWRPYIRKLDNVYQSGICGKLLKMHYINGHTGPLGIGARHRGVNAAADPMTDEERAATWWYQKKMGGGAFLDIGCYGAMYSTWFQVGNPLDVFADARNLNTPYCDSSDNVVFIVNYPTSLSVLEGTWTMPNKFLPTGPVLCCEEGVIYTTADRQVKAMDLSGNEIFIPESMPECDPNICTLYTRHVQNNIELHKTVTLPFNLRVTALLETAIKSAAEGTRKNVPEVR